MPPHNYTLEADQSDVLEYFRKHGDGRRTVVQATRRPKGWRTFAKDYPRGGGQGPGRTIGTFPSKGEARRAMAEWMSRHPEGVAGGGLDFGAGLNLGDDLFGNSPFGGGGLF